MRVAHLLRFEGDLVGPELDRCTSSALAEVRRSHPAGCAAVVIDLTRTCRVSSAVVPRLRELRTSAREVGVVLSLLVRSGSAADRVLSFHLRLGEALPTVHYAPDDAG